MMKNFFIITNSYKDKDLKVPTGGKTKKIYYRVSLGEGCIFVHRLIASIRYGGKIPSKLHVNHIDGDTENNQEDNLEIVTHKENSAHAKREGLYCSGQDWYNARKLNL